MSHKLNTEMLMKEILEIIKKHSLPVQSVSLDISLLSKEFEEIFPHLKTYKAGRFYKQYQISDTPVAFMARRRIPFVKLTGWLKENAYPYLQQAVYEIEQDFEEIQTILRMIDDKDSKFSFNNFRIEVECRRKSEPTIEERNTILLSIGIRQLYETSIPVIFGFVGWLVDQESGDDWGIDTIYDLNQLNLEVNESQLIDIERQLPYLRQHLVNELMNLTTRNNATEN